MRRTASAGNKCWPVAQPEKGITVLTVMMADGRAERKKTAEGPDHSVSLLNQGGKLTDLE